MDRDEILLKEYEICQQDSSSMVSVQWTAFGIIIGINTAILGALGYGLISRIGILSVGDEWLVSGFGIGAIFLLVLLKFWMKRVSWLVNINNERMRQIETKLGMSKNWLFQHLDDEKEWKKLLESERNRLRLIYEKRPRPNPRGIWCAKALLYVLILLWFFFVSSIWFPAWPATVIVILAFFIAILDLGLRTCLRRRQHLDQTHQSPNHRQWPHHHRALPLSFQRKLESRGEKGNGFWPAPE